MSQSVKISSLLANTRSWLLDCDEPLRSERFLLLKNLVAMPQKHGNIALSHSDFLAMGSSPLKPFAHLEGYPLTIGSLQYCIDSCHFINSPSRLEDFLRCLGVMSARNNLVTYNHVGKWDLDYRGRPAISAHNSGRSIALMDIAKWIADNNFKHSFLSGLRCRRFG